MEPMTLSLDSLNPFNYLMRFKLGDVNPQINEHLKVIILTKALESTNILNTPNISKSIDMYKGLLCVIMPNNKSSLVKVTLIYLGTIYAS